MLLRYCSTWHPGTKERRKTSVDVVDIDSLAFWLQQIDTEGRFAAPADCWAHLTWMYLGNPRTKSRFKKLEKSSIIHWRIFHSYVRLPEDTPQTGHLITHKIPRSIHTCVLSVCKVGVSFGASCCLAGHQVAIGQSLEAERDEEVDNDEAWCEALM
jgi:hypothetical protein